MTERPTVVVTGPWSDPGWDAALRAAGADVIMGPSIDERPATPVDEATLCEMVARADAVLVSSRERITARVLDAAPRLRLVAKATIGVERIDVEAATERGILVVNSPAPENVVGLAEATIGLIIALAKQLLVKEQRIRDGGWRDATTDGLVLAGRTVGIIGLGRVGSGVARRLVGWDVDVLACDPYIPVERFAAAGAGPVDLPTLLSQSDIVTLHVPLTAETRGMIDAEALAAMPVGALLVNTSRGAVVDQAAIAQALQDGHLGAAALDVFETEPLPPDDPIRAVPRDRVLLTPHSIGSSHASRATGTRMAIAAVLDALGGRVPPNVVNAAALHRWRRRFGAE